MYLPKIKLENSYLLNDNLAQLGFKEVFGSNADFSSLTDFKPIFISQVKQKTYFEMDEKGTTAAAATSLNLSMEKKDPIVMKCNRPYFIFLTKYCLALKKTLILFSAKIENP